MGEKTLIFLLMFVVTSFLSEVDGERLIGFDLIANEISILTRWLRFHN